MLRAAWLLSKVLRMGVDAAALIVSILAFLVAGLGAYFARRQVAAANTQAEASKAQAAAATEALNQAASWRAEEERRAEPQFRVNVEPINDLRDGQIVSMGEMLYSVDVVVENTSSRDATINHVGVEDLTGSPHILGSHDLGVEFPYRLARGDQIEFSLPGSHFLGLLGDGADGFPKESEFVVFVAKSHFLSDGSAAKRWNSKPFTVRLPSFPRHEQ